MPEAYMVPSKVYVGDRASLMLPLPGIAGNGNIEINPGYISSPDIDIHHVTIERRPTGSFLKIEFSAYTPGILELPPFDVAGKIFSGLTVEISSILESGESGMVLSGPALPLAIPGTSLLIYGTISSGILLMLLTIWVLFRGRAQMKGWLAVWKRRWLLVSMLDMEKRLRKALAKGAVCRKILDVISTEFRNFLACFTGENCRAMTAVEIGRLKNREGSEVSVPDGEFLGKFFSRCDDIRFSGAEISGDETLAVLGDLRGFLTEMSRSMQKKAAQGKSIRENPA
ncbi:MAG: hypothetical protein LBB89_10065 [Treponema sp.]|jgi:hypothetical protein|nr:hypothetical protein [Treponema sp.]